MLSIDKKTGFILCIIYFALMVIPAEVFFQIGSIRMEPYRIFLILTALYLLPKIIKHHQFELHEKALLIYCLWCLFSFIVNHKAAGIQSGIILFLEIFVGYFIGISLGGQLNSLKKFLYVVLAVFAILIPFAITESQDGYRILHVVAASVFNTPVEVYLGDQYFRHGLHRASTIFSHPILYSVCAVATLPLVYFLFGRFKATLMSAGLFVAMITSVTSAGFVMLGIQIILYTAKQLQKTIPSIFKIITYVSIISYIFSSLFSNRGPVLLLIQFVSLNPATSYARYMQWQYAADDVANNPFFGIGFYEWSRPFWMDSSIDSFWLLSALQNGYPASFALGAFVILSSMAHWKTWKKTSNTLFFTFFITFFSIAFAAFTVDFFDRAQLFVFLVFGMCNSFLVKKKELVK